MKSLNDWLSYLENAHSAGLIDMGLTRVGEVKKRMNLQPQCPVIVVAGTNGKGSVCAILTEIYRQAGFKVGTLTSPHLLKYNERITINTKPASDNTIIASFEHIQAACADDVSLTYFEFNTLAAVDIFIREHVDVMILEVGLGGRLDAVNVFDADCAVVASVDLDHQAYLGNSIEEVAYEKAGVFRSGKAAICGQYPAPKSLCQYAEKIGAELVLNQRDFHYSQLEQQWSFHFHPQQSSLFDEGFNRNRNALPIPALRGAYQLNNSSCALAAIECLYDQLPIDIGAIKRGLLLVKHPARFQILPGRPLVLLDVGHNPHAARALRQGLIHLPFAEKRLAVFSMLADKDVDSVLEIIKDQIDEWYIAPLLQPRGMKVEQLMKKMQHHTIENVKSFDKVQNAYQAALASASENDRIAVFGSFYTVADVMAIL